MQKQNTEDFTEKELLNFMLESDMLNLSDIKKLKKDMLLKEKSKIVEKHPYTIFKSEKNGRYKTTIKDEKMNQKRRQVSRKTLEEIYDFLIDHYETQENLNNLEYQNKLTEKSTIRDIYNVWIKSRILEVKSSTTVKKNQQDFNRFYDKSYITDIPIQNLSANKLKDWAHKTIDEYNLNKKAYYNMALIIKKCYEYINDEGVYDNVWKNVKINTSKLKKTVKKENVTEIYFEKEIEMITNYSYQKFNENRKDITALIFPFLFCTGLRIGEVVALKYEDFSDNYISVERSEVNDYVYNEETQKFNYTGKKIVDHVKTDAGIRKVPYTERAKKIISLIKEASLSFDFYDNNFVFCPRSKRIQSNSLDTKLSRYCKLLNLSEKSCHKIRKTYISKLIINGIDLDTVCKVSGHTDLKTTFDSYLFALNTESEIHEQFEEILS